MRLALYFMVVVSLLGSAARAAETDLDRLQGEWLFESAEENGNPSDAMKGTTLTFIADNIVVHTNRSGVGHYDANPVKLNETASPRQLTILRPLQDSKSQATAIYKIEQDTLTIGSMDAPKGPMTPTDFTSGEKKKIIKLKRQAPVEPPKGDMKNLQGSWTIESCERNGKDRDEIKGVTLVIRGDLAVNTLKLPDGTVMIQVTRLQLDETASPRRITIANVNTDDEHKARGIYTLDGAQLKICARDGNDVEFPAGFKAADAALMVLKRKE